MVVMNLPDRKAIVSVLNPFKKRVFLPLIFNFLMEQLKIIVISSVSYKKVMRKEENGEWPCI